MDGRTDGRTMDATPWHKLIGPFGPDELKIDIMTKNISLNISILSYNETDITQTLIVLTYKLMETYSWISVWTQL